MNTTESTIAQRATELQDYIATGRIFEALDEFYAEDVVMQENMEAPIAGRAANIEREKAWLDTVETFTGFTVENLAVGGDVSFVETSMSYIAKDGQKVELTQVSRARWRDGKIVDERFYHG